MQPTSALFDDYDPPMLIVTAAGPDGPSGCLVGFSTQCSIFPRRLLVCLSVLNRTADVAATATALGVHVLGADQRALAELFGGESGDDVDKFAGLDWRRGASGAPIVHECARWVEGVVLDRLPLGDHTGYLLEVTDSGSGPHSGVLRMRDVSKMEPGHPAEEVLDPEPVDRPAAPADQAR